MTPESSVPGAVGERPVLDVERTRIVLIELTHEVEHPGNGAAESCIECLNEGDRLIRRLSGGGNV